MKKNILNLWYRGIKNLFAILLTLSFGAVSAQTINGGNYAGADLEPANGSTLNGTFTNVGKFHIKPGFTVYITQGTAFSVSAKCVVVEGILDGTGRGYLGGAVVGSYSSNGLPGAGPGGGQEGYFGACVHGSGGGGGAHGGNGGNGSINSIYTGGGAGGTANGISAFPGANMGSGGASGARHCSGGGTYGDPPGVGGNGGASIEIIASGRILVSGSILAKGADGGDGVNATYAGTGGGGGAGGSINITAASGFITGTLNANGGQGGDAGIGGAYPQAGGGGSGGRIKIFSSLCIDGASITVNGGAKGCCPANPAPDATAGSSGTIVGGVVCGTTPITANGVCEVPASLDFDGTNDKVLTNLFITGSYTKECWIYVRDITNNSNNFITGNSDLGYGTTTISTPDYFGGYLGAGHGFVSSWNDVSDVAPITLNTWIHVAVTYDLATTTMKLYKNGALIDVNNSVPDYGTDLVEIGAWGSGYYTDGKLDEIRIWNKVRTQAEIQANMNCDIAPQSGLIALYHCNDGEPNVTNTGIDTLVDVSGNNNIGTMSGFALTGSTSNWSDPAIGHEIEVSGNSIIINDGDVTPALTEHTDFGSGTFTRTFTIKNINVASLKIDSIKFSGANASDFSVTTSPSSTIAGGSNSTFVVTFVPSALGLRNATLTIYTNDCDEGQYNFDIQGTGIKGRMLDFDGTNDFANQGTTSLLNFGKANAITIESWVKSDIGSSNLQSVYSKYDASWVGYGLQIQNGKAELYLIANYLGNDALWIRSNYSPDLRDGKWHHIAAVYDGSNSLTNMKVFIDGVDYGSTSLSASSIAADFTNSGRAMFGACDYGGSPGDFMNGQLDELRIWNTVRTQAEIQNSMNCELSPQSGLIAIYHLDQGIAGGLNPSITSAVDSSGNNINGTLLNFALTGTASNWMHTAGVGQEINITGNAISIASGDTFPSVSDNTDFGQVVPGINDVVTYTIQNTGVASLNISSITLTGVNPSDFTIGSLTPSSPIPSGGSATFTVSFVASTTGPKTAIVNVNSSDCDENLYTFKIQAEKSKGAALDFDGTDDYVGIPILNLSSGNKMTIEAWVKPTDITTNSYYEITRQDGTDWLLSFQDNGTILSYGLYTTTGYHELDVSITSTNYTDGNWHHITAVYDGDSMKLFKDGTQIGSMSKTGNINYSNWASASIGSYPNGGGEFFKGKIDEVRIWNRALCEDEITHYKNCEISTTSNGLLANYHFNQGIAFNSNPSETTLYDSSGNSFNGNLYNFALSGNTSNWIAPGAVNSGVSCGPKPLEIDIRGNNISISDGDNSTSTTDNTNLGSVEIYQPIVKTFKIYSLGNDTLEISSITTTGANSADFVVQSMSYPKFILGGDSFSFNVTFTPSGLKNRSATLTINNTDCNEAVYNFKISGNGLLPPPTPVTASPSIICAGSSSNLNAKTVGDSVLWYTTAVGGSPIGKSDSAQNFSVSPAVTTTYYAESFSRSAKTIEYFIPLASLNGNTYSCGNPNYPYGYGNVGFSWTDNESSVPLSVVVELAVGIECDPTSKSTVLNGVSQPSFNTNYDCNCTPDSTINKVTKIVLNPNDYLPGTINQFNVTNGNTFGYMQHISLNNYFAKVTVEFLDTVISATRTPVTVTVGCDGNGIDFDGVNDVVTIPGGGSLNNQQSGTIEMWVKWNGTQDPSYASSSYGAVMARQSNSVFSNQIIALNTNNPTTARVVWNPYSYAGTAITSTSIVGDGVWNHIAIVYSSGSHSMYINGVLEGTSSMTGTIANNPAKALSIGGWIDDGSGYSKSVIDEVRIWNSLRTQTEIQNNMNCDIAQNANLKAYYRFNHGTAGGTNTGMNGVFDYSGNGNCGTLNNAALSGTNSNWVVAKTPMCVNIPTCDGNSATPTVAGTYTSTFSSTDVNGYRYFCDCQSKLLLALKPGGTGAVVTDNSVQLNVTSMGATFYPSPTGFVVNGSGWSGLDRTWNVVPSTQPTSPIPVRFYFNSTDVTNINNSLIANSVNPIGGPDSMTFYKVTNPIKPAHAAVASLIPGDIKVIFHGSSVTDSTWTTGVLGGGNYFAEFAVTSFSGGGGGAGPDGITPLPVELLYLTAKAVDNNHIKLDWATASEINSNYFDVQRSTDGVHFTTIGNVKAAGNSFKELLYSINDFNVQQNVTYFYRLNMVDLNGSHEYSNVVLGRLNSAASINAGVVTMYPNPAKTELNIVWPEGLETADIAIRSVEGKTVLTQRVDATHKSVIGLQHLLPGIYTVSLTINGEIQNQKLVIQK